MVIVLVLLVMKGLEKYIILEGNLSSILPEMVFQRSYIK